MFAKRDILFSIAKDNLDIIYLLVTVLDVYVDKFYMLTPCHQQLVISKDRGV